MAVGLINNVTTSNNYTDYNLYDSLTVNVAKGLSVYIGKYYKTDHVLVWADWNRDGDFNDANEAVFSGLNTSGFVSTTITAPTGTTAGQVRMRVRITDSKNLPNYTPCGVSKYGEVEDYKLIIR